MGSISHKGSKWEPLAHKTGLFPQNQPSRQLDLWNVVFDVMDLISVAKY